MWYFLFSFFIGCSVGSFVNVLIDRTILGENWVSGRSHCDHCHKTLKWYDMIPILSYMFYLGKSRCCKAPLSYRYPLVEMIVGLLFVWWLGMGFWFFKLVSAPLTIIQPGFWLLTGIFIVIMGLADLFYGVVLVSVVWVASIVTLIYRFVLLHYREYQVADIKLSLLSAALFYGFFWLLHKLTKGRGMADGDMYVAMYVGLLLGWPRGLVAMILSFILGAVVGVSLIATGIKTRKDSLPFVPFLMTASVIALIWGTSIWQWMY